MNPNNIKMYSQYMKKLATLGKKINLTYLPDLTIYWFESPINFISALYVVKWISTVFRDYS